MFTQCLCAQSSVQAFFARLHTCSSLAFPQPSRTQVLIRTNTNALEKKCSPCSDMLYSHENLSPLVKY